MFNHIITLKKYKFKTQFKISCIEFEKTERVDNNMDWEERR